VRSFTDAGYLVESATSDWVLQPDERAFQRQLIEGWAHAAAEIAPEQAALVDDWLRRRQSHIDVGCSRIIVRHHDMAAVLPATNPASENASVLGASSFVHRPFVVLGSWCAATRRVVASSH
jgi:hypothetical protein